MKIIKHKVGVLGLTAIGVGTMIGSGWLFSSYYAAKGAGASSFFSWIVTSVIILILGLCLSEIASLHPKRGLMARLLVISHNKDFAFICTISTWLALVAAIATEAEGTVQYVSSLSKTLGPDIFNAATHSLTGYGLLFGVVLVLIYGLINFWGVRLMSNSNVVLTACKILIPSITAISIMVSMFHSHNFVGYHDKLLPYGASSIFLVIISAGMLYSFNGFQNIVAFASEVKKPWRDIPLAMVLAVCITLIVYILLEFAFIGSISPEKIAQGWGTINFTSPFVQITAMLNLNLITIILYVDSIASPSGTGLIYTGSTTRMLTAMSEDRQMPRFFNKLCKYNFSRRSLALIIILAIVFLFLFRSWSALVSFLSVFYVISYLSIPLCLGKLRHEKERAPFRMPFAPIIAPVMFVFLSCLFEFAKFPDTAYVTLFTFICYALYLLMQLRNTHHPFMFTFKRSYLLMLYLIALTVISFIGPTEYGGIHLLGKPVFFLVVAIIALIFYFFSVRKYSPC